VFFVKKSAKIWIFQKNEVPLQLEWFSKTGMAQHNILGRQGEDLAVDFLQKKGYSILVRNWRLNDLEVDIIAKDGEEVVFVEVKTRASYAWGNPEDAVDELRKRRMTAAANAFLKFRRIDNPFRFDIIAIVMNGKETRIDHIEEAFSPRAHYIGPGSYNPENKWTKSCWKRKK